MKESRAYKFSLALPLVVPALLAPLLSLESRLPEWLTTVAVLTVYSGLAGGVPYVVTVVLLFWWGRNKSDTQFKRALVFSPVLMLPVFFAFLVIFSLITQGFRDEAEAADVLRMLLVYGSLILGFGYAYVLLVLSTVFVLKRLGVVAASPAI